MKNSDPLVFLLPGLSSAMYRRLLILLLVLTGLTGVVMLMLDQSLKTTSAPLGIVSFELAGDIPTAQAIVLSWQGQAKVYAALGLGLDYLFLLLYPLTMMAACVLLANIYQQGMRASMGRVLAWLILLAVILDAVENYALWRLLLEDWHPLWPRLSLICAMPKFVLIVACLAYIALAGFGLVFHRKDRKNG